MIKAEIWQDKAILLDQYGRIWQVEIDFNQQPMIQSLKEVSHDRTNYLMWSKLLAEVGLHP